MAERDADSAIGQKDGAVGPPDSELVDGVCSSEVGSRSASGVGLTLGGQLGQLVITQAAGAILSRLLTPADFGLFQMTIVFVQFPRLLADLGLTLATIQRPDLTNRQLSAVFWVNLGVAVVLGLIVVAGSPLVAAFYDQPELTAMTATLGLVFLGDGLGAQHMALLRRRMRFGRLVSINLGAAAIGSVVAITLGWLGAAAWAIVALHLGTSLGRTAGAWWMSGWRPAFVLRGSGALPMLKFGGWLTASELLSYVTENADRVLIGRFLGETAVGFYGKAYSLLLMPIMQISSPLAAVAIPALSRLNERPDAYRAYFLRINHIFMSLAVPCVALLYWGADLVIEVMAGGQWGKSAELFRVLTIGAFFRIIYSTTAHWPFVTQGRGREMLRFRAITTAAFLSAFAIGVQWGVTGVAIGYNAAIAFAAVLGMTYALRSGPVSAPDLLRVVWSPLAAGSGAMAIGLAADRTLGRFLPAGGLWQDRLETLAVCAAVALGYLALWSAWPGNRALLADAIVTARGLMTRRQAAD